MGIFGKIKKENSNDVLLVQIYCKAMNCVITDFGKGVTVALLREGNSSGKIALRFATYCFANVVRQSLMNDIEKKVFVHDMKFLLPLLRGIGDIPDRDIIHYSEMLDNIESENETCLGLVLSDRVMLQGDIVSLA